MFLGAYVQVGGRNRIDPHCRVRGELERLMTRTIVLMGQAFHPKEDETAATPALAAAVSTTVRPSAPTAADALSRAPSLPAMVNHAQNCASTLSSVLQWSAA